MLIRSLTPGIIKGFVEEFLWQDYDNPVDVSSFHTELWELFCLDKKYVAAAAPRGHAKTTAGTIAFSAASLCFRKHKYITLVSKTLGQSIEFLQNIRSIFYTNEAVQATFGFKRFLRDREDDLIIQWSDMTQSRMKVFGSDQEIRGTLWMNRRPDLILFDDPEGDEQVESPERRKKFKHFVMKVVIPLGNKQTKVRWVDTIKHYDCFLENILKNPSWTSKRFSAHASFDDFSNILWPQRFDEAELREIRQMFIDSGTPDIYAQEYLNIPAVEGEGFFRAQDFIAMGPEDHDKPKKFYVGIDFAISQKQHADYTVMVVAGMDSQNFLHIVDLRKGRWDGKEINDEMLSIRSRWNPELYFVEAGAIKLALGPFLHDSMRKAGKFFSLQEFVSTEDKFKRNQSFKAMMRSGSVKFDEGMDGYEGLRQEMTQFGRRKGKDDQVDACGMFGIGLEYMIEPDVDEVMDGLDDDDEEVFAPRRAGRSLHCGY